jgi:hypothetical protein
MASLLSSHGDKLREAREHDVMVDQDNGTDPLPEHGWTSVKASVLRAALGQVSFPSGVMGMLQGPTAGEDRILRAQGYVDQLSVLLDEIDARTLHGLLREPVAFDLFQEGARQAVRSASQDRLRVIAELVSNGLRESADGQAEATRLLSELSAIGDDSFGSLRNHIRSLKDAYAARLSTAEPQADSGDTLFGQLAEAIALARSMKN